MQTLTAQMLPELITLLVQSALTTSVTEHYTEARLSALRSFIFSLAEQLLPEAATDIDDVYDAVEALIGSEPE